MKKHTNESLRKAIDAGANAGALAKHVPTAGAVATRGRSSAPPIETVARNSAGAVPQTQPAPKPIRPANLKGLESAHIWLLEQGKAMDKTPIAPKTIEQYTKIGERLDAARKRGEPVDLSQYEDSPATFYMYRAAVRRYAALRGQQAARDYSTASKKKDENAKAEAWQRVLHYAADLVAYPPDGPGVVAGGDADRAQRIAVKTGLADKPAKKPKPDTKLQDTNAITHLYPGWRGLIWERLVEVKSPWIDWAAVSALTGARPDELARVVVRKSRDGLEISIEGAKVSDVKGQPWRVIQLADDGTPEYAHVVKKASPEWRSVPVPESSADPANAFSVALGRAGAQVLKHAPRFSAYCYRHSFASDLKADHADKDTIARALGHAVTRTQDAYGRASGGRAGARKVAVYAARQEIKQTHGTGFKRVIVGPTVIEETPIYQSPEGPK